jgi:hypothetical protein
MRTWVITGVVLAIAGCSTNESVGASAGTGGTAVTAPDRRGTAGTAGLTTGRFCFTWPPTKQASRKNWTTAWSIERKC